MRSTVSWSGLALALGLACLSSVPARAQSGFLERFAGKWEGSGEVRRNLDSGPMGISCSLSGASAGDSATVSGRCRALAIFSRQITIELRENPNGKGYVGRYLGSRIGPAALSGTRNGRDLNLTIRWPKPVNGDLTAQMTIRMDESGGMRLVVADQPSGGGAPVQTTDISLARQ